MSVVPFTTEGENPTVVQRPEDFKANGNAILIQDIELEQLTDKAKNSNVSYDLRVGREYRDHRDAGKRELREGQHIVLHSGTAVVVETEEFVHLSRNQFALVVPKVSLLQKGVSNTMSKVDPGYQGHLLVTLFNLGKETVRLSHLDRCCSLCVLRVEGNVIPYRKTPKRIEGWASEHPWRAFRDLLERNQGLLMAILISVTILSIIF